MSGPRVVSVNPSAGEGSAQVFTAEFSIENGRADLDRTRLHFQASAAIRTNRCVVRYEASTRSLYLLSDQAGKYLGPIAAGGNDSLWNNRCLLSGCSNAQVSGATTLTVQFAVRFNPAQFAGPHRMFLEIVDARRHASPAGDVGSWTVPAAQPEAPARPWPADRSCPAATPASPKTTWTASAVDCKAVSGSWSDPETGGTWSLNQTANKISGSLTIAKPECGIVSWRL